MSKEKIYLGTGKVQSFDNGVKKEKIIALLRDGVDESEIEKLCCTTRKYIQTVARKANIKLEDTRTSKFRAKKKEIIYTDPFAMAYRHLKSVGLR